MMHTHLLTYFTLTTMIGAISHLHFAEEDIEVQIDYIISSG
jgi:hypothetical protein